MGSDRGMGSGLKVSMLLRRRERRGCTAAVQGEGVHVRRVPVSRASRRPSFF